MKIGLVFTINRLPLQRHKKRKGGVKAALGDQEKDLFS
jgi:hypothetical protein